jgi:hypothetical protein
VQIEIKKGKSSRIITFDLRKDMMGDGPETGYKNVKRAHNMKPSSSTQAPQTQETYHGCMNDP